MKNLIVVFTSLLSLPVWSQSLSCSEFYFQGSVHRIEGEKSFEEGGEAYASIQPHDSRGAACVKIHTAVVKTKQAVSQMRNAASYYTEARGCGYPDVPSRIVETNSNVAYYKSHADKYEEVYRQACSDGLCDTWVCEAWGTFNHATGRGITRGQAESTAFFFCGEATCRITRCYKL